MSAVNMFVHKSQQLMLPEMAGIEERCNLKEIIEIMKVLNA